MPKEALGAYGRLKRLAVPAATSLSLLMSAACSGSSPDATGGGDSSGLEARANNNSLVFPFKKPLRFTAGPHPDDPKMPSGPMTISNAIDLAAEKVFSCGDSRLKDYPIISSSYGKVVAVGDPNNPLDPKHSMVEVKVPKDNNTGLIIKYMHVDNAKVKEGQEVTPDTEIGITGCEAPPHLEKLTDGRSALVPDKVQSPHLHFSLDSYEGTEGDIFRSHKPIEGTVLSDWVIKAGSERDQGTLEKSGQQIRTADARVCGPDEASVKACGGIRNDLDRDMGESKFALVPDAKAAESETGGKAPIVLKIGGKAKVTGTGDCLPIRDEPAPKAKVLNCVTDGTVVDIAAGPITAENNIWWNIKDDPNVKGGNINGWGSGTYLKAIEGSSTSLPSQAEVKVQPTWTPVPAKPTFTPIPTKTIENQRPLTLDEQAIEYVMQRTFNLLNTEQGQPGLTGLKQTGMGSPLNYLKIETIETGKVNGRPIQAKDIVLGIVPENQNYLKLRWRSESWNDIFRSGEHWRLAAGEIEVRNLSGSITESNRMTPADTANGLRWQGKIGLSYIVRSRTIVKMSKDRETLEFPNQSFTNWSNDFTSGDAKLFSGAWQRAFQPPFILMPVSPILSLGPIGSFYSQLCPEFAITGCLVPPQ